jgi:glycosyltransferase involved in cell wall biosynthesis
MKAADLSAVDSAAALAALAARAGRAGDFRLALVADALAEPGGAEAVLAAAHRLDPSAPVFAPVFRPERLPDAFRAMDVRTSSLQARPALAEHHRGYLARCAGAVARFDLAGFDAVLSVSRAFAIGARVPRGALHACYCCTPLRPAWDRAGFLAEHGVSGALRKMLLPGPGRLQRHDAQAAAGVHQFIAPSRAVAARIAAAYRRDAVVLPPPVAAGRFYVDEPDDYFLVVARLDGRANVDLAIDAVNRTRHRLLIAGTGPAEAGLRRIAGPRVAFLGRVPEEELAARYAHARALIAPGEAEAEVALLEAMAAGRPVVALARGLAADVVVEGETGLFFGAPTADSLLLALQRFEPLRFDPQAIRRHALAFDTSAFLARLETLLRERLAALRDDPLWSR